MKKEYQDIVIIDADGIILYIDVANVKTFELPPEQIIGKSVTELYKNIDESTSTLIKAVRTGESTIDCEQELITQRDSKITQISSTYPIMDGVKIIGAIEFSEYKYRLDSIEYIRSHWDRPVYRKNNTRYTLDDIITVDPKMIKLKKTIQRVARIDSAILVYGKTGTGKELVVQSIHNLSSRVNKPFISQNCGAIPDTLVESTLFGTVKGGFTGAEDKIGILEAAQGGTVFLDEINSLSLELQVKLLKVIEDQKIRRVGDTKEINLNVRFIAATNEDPEELIQKGLFRADLYYRLSVVQLELPQLRHRTQDIGLLANHFIDYYNHKLQRNLAHLSEAMLYIFEGYPWPGNVRELRNIIEGIFNLAEDDKLTEDCFPTRMLGFHKDRKPDITDAPPFFNDLGIAVKEYEMKLIMAAFKRNRYNMAKTARELGISRQLLHYKLNSSD